MTLYIGDYNLDPPDEPDEEWFDEEDDDFEIPEERYATDFEADAMAATENDFWYGGPK